MFTGIASGSSCFGNERLAPQKGRKSETRLVVNTLEKIASPKFSIRVFGSVYVSGSQIISLRTATPLLLTPSVFLRRP